MSDSEAAEEGDTVLLSRETTSKLKRLRRGLERLNLLKRDGAAPCNDKLRVINFSLQMSLDFVENCSKLAANVDRERPCSPALSGVSSCQSQDNNNDSAYTDTPQTEPCQYRGEPSSEAPETPRVDPTRSLRGARLESLCHNFRSELDGDVDEDGPRSGLVLSQEEPENLVLPKSSPATQFEDDSSRPLQVGQPVAAPVLPDDLQLALVRRLAQRRAFVDNLSANPAATEPGFRCGFCMKGFHNRTYLQTHLRTHTGVRPYSCENCSWTFRTKSNLNRHNKNVHNLRSTGAVYRSPTRTMQLGELVHVKRQCIEVKEEFSDQCDSSPGSSSEKSLLIEPVVFQENSPFVATI